MKYRIIDHYNGTLIGQFDNYETAASKMQSLCYKAEMHNEDYDYDVDLCDMAWDYKEYCMKIEGEE